MSIKGASSKIAVAHFLKRCRCAHVGRALLPAFLAGLALLLLLGSGGDAAQADLPESILHDQIVAAVISQVATQTLEYELAGLTGERSVVVAGLPYTIATRNSYYTDPISMATRYAYEQFAGYGLVVTYHNYIWNGPYWRNVVAEKPGVVDPDEIYLITAHVDDMPSSSLAPGADDNGSGSVAVMMAARLLAPHRFTHTLRFVLFTGEEQGLRGSAAYAADCQSLGENIQGVINLDMIGYNTDEPVFDAYARSGTYPGALESRHLADLFSDVAVTYNLDLVPYRIDMDSYPLMGGSDQSSFLDLGYPAIMVAGNCTAYDCSPYYHTTLDTLSTLDLDYYADLTRAAIATLAHLGQLLPGGYLSGTVYAADTGYPLSATVAAYAPAYHSAFNALADGSGVYSISLPVDSYTLTVWPASRDYCPTTITNVTVITDFTTIQNVAALSPCLRSYLPWIARES